MKLISKAYLLALSTTALLFSCSKDNEIDDDSSRTMTFRATESLPEDWKPLNNSNTRTTSADVSSKYSLYVCSCLFGDDVTNPGQYIPKQKLDPTSDNGWTATGWYWPVNGQMDFIGWGGSSDIDTELVSMKTEKEGNLVTMETFNAPLAELSINFTGSNAITGTNDVIYSDLVTCSCANKPVAALRFSHALSRLQITLKAENDDAANHMKIDEIGVENVLLSGKMLVEKKSEGMVSRWDETMSSLKRTMSGFSGKELIDADKNYQTLEDGFFALPQDPATMLITYHIDNNSDHKLSFRFNFKNLTADWLAGNQYTYNFSCSLKKIQAGAGEEDWQTEIGGGAFEPEWNVEVSTGAYETSWKTEIDGEAYEMHWSVEIQTSALESIWLVEILAGANESNWNTEMSGGANENDWNSETSGSALEEGWNSETSGNAFEEKWEEDPNPIVIPDPSQSSSDPTNTED